MTSVSPSATGRSGNARILPLFCADPTRHPGSAVAHGHGVSFGRVTLALFLACQASDGLLTYAAVTALGHAVEGNPILATWMQLAGAGPTLLAAKLIACGCGCILYFHRTFRVLAALTGLYLVGAIAPWLHILISR